MEGKIISSEEVFASGSGEEVFHDGRSFEVKRLVVEKADNLAITLLKDEVYAITGFNFRDEDVVISRVEVPHKLIKKALAFVRAKAELDSFKDLLKALLG